MIDREMGLAGGSLQARSENEVRTSNSSNNASTIATQAARRGGRRHRQKGDRRERELVHRHRELGFRCERYPSSGATHFRNSSHDLDVYLNGPEEAPLVFESKARRNGEGFATLERWLQDFDGLFLRRDGVDPLILLPWKTWARLLERVRR